MLGNDLIDLQDLDAQPESFRPGFDDRVFSVEERREIAGDTHPLSRRWAHWGAKEAAYKLARQIDSTFVFSPRRLVARFEPGLMDPAGRLERRGRLVLIGLAPGSEGIDPRRRIPSLTLELISFETPERIHVIAAPEKTDWGSVDFAVEKMSHDQIDSSLAVRSLAVREIGRKMGIAPERISIGRRGKIPTVLLDGASTSMSLSLSHHGAWISYATGLAVEAEPSEIWIAEGRPSRPMSSTPLISPNGAMRVQPQ